MKTLNNSLPAVKIKLLRFGNYQKSGLMKLEIQNLMIEQTKFQLKNCNQKKKSQNMIKKNFQQILRIKLKFQRLGQRKNKTQIQTMT